MINESNSQPIELPDRKEISLCEAVTAVVYGKAMDIRQWQRACECAILTKSFDGWQHESGFWVAASSPHQASPKESKANELLEKLSDAAYAGRVKFRAVPEGTEDGYKDIDPLYFYVRPFFNWPGDVIYQRENESSRPWYFVHLDREQFVTLLKDMGFSVRHPTRCVEEEGKTFRTGAAGRPTSIHFVLKIARRRLDAGDYPDKATPFSEQLAAELKVAEPDAAPIKPKTIRNNPEFRELWRRKQPRPK